MVLMVLLISNYIKYSNTPFHSTVLLIACSIYDFHVLLFVIYVIYVLLFGLLLIFIGLLFILFLVYKYNEGKNLVWFQITQDCSFQNVSFLIYSVVTNVSKVPLT